MDTAAVDFPALVLATVIAAVITAVLFLAHREDNNRRGWIAAAAVTAILLAIGLADLLREKPRETFIAAPLIAAALPVLGATGMIRGTRRMRPWLRWLLVFVTTFLLLFTGLLLGATVLPKYLPT
jgi:hypothetical protein